MREIKYSVIVPVFNRESTVQRCLSSLIHTERDDIQIIAVNDGSTDNSGPLLDQFAEAYPCVQVLHQENAGVSRARNAGLQLAKGTYITFVDSDDYVTENYFSVLDQLPDSDLAVFGHTYHGQKELDESRLFADLEKAESDFDRLELLLSSRKIMIPTNKRFKGSMIGENKLLFTPDMHIGEDFCFCMSYSLLCASIICCRDQIMVVDISGTDSLSRKYRPHLDQQMQQVFYHVANAIKASPLSMQEQQQLLRIADYLYAKNACTSIAEEFKAQSNFRNPQRETLHSICDTFRTPLSSGYCSFVHFTIRFLLKYRQDWVIFLVTWLIKGRK